MPITEALAPHFTDELKADPIVSGYYEKQGTVYNSVPDVLKSLAHSQKQLDNVIPLYNGEAKPEDVEKWRGEQNAKLKDRGFAIAPLRDLRQPPPESPEKYEFKFPEGVKSEDVASDPLLKEFKSFAHTKGYSNQEAADIINWWSEKGAPELAKKFQPPQADFIEGDNVRSLFEKEFKEQTNQILDEYPRNVETINRTIPGLKDTLNESVAPYGEKLIMLGDHPVIVKLVNLIADLTRPDFAGHVNGGVTVNPDADALLAEARDIMQNKDNPKHALYAKNDKATVQYVADLYKKADPSERTL